MLLGTTTICRPFAGTRRRAGEDGLEPPKDASEIERRRSDGGGLLAGGWRSRGNMFSGDAQRCSATMSAISDRKRSGSGEYFAYFADPYGFMRTIALTSGTSFWNCAPPGGSGSARGARQPRWPLPPDAGAITVVMRDLNVATLMGDIVEGVPVVYSTFVGYDEVAHHSGVEQPDAFAVLKQHDAQLARLERAVDRRLAPTTWWSSRTMDRARDALPAALRRRAPGDRAERSGRRRGFSPPRRRMRD